MTRIVNLDSPRRATQKLEKVHTDMWGPYRVPSIGGNIYFLSLIDDLMRKSWLICMKSQKEIFQRMSEWQTATYLQSSEKVALYHCENAREYQRFEHLESRQQHSNGIHNSIYS